MGRSCSNSGVVRYLGFVVGRGSGTHSWDKSLVKLQSRVGMCSAHKFGMHYTAEFGNTLLSDFCSNSKASLQTLWRQSKLRYVSSLLAWEPGGWAKHCSSTCETLGLGFEIMGDHASVLQRRPESSRLEGNEEPH